MLRQTLRTQQKYFHKLACLACGLSFIKAHILISNQKYVLSRIIIMMGDETKRVEKSGRKFSNHSLCRRGKVQNTSQTAYERYYKSALWVFCDAVDASLALRSHTQEAPFLPTAVCPAITYSHTHTARISHCECETCTCTLYALALSRHAGSLSVATERYLGRRHVGNYRHNWSTAPIWAQIANAFARGPWSAQRAFQIAEFHLRVCAWWLRDRFSVGIAKPKQLAI